MAAQIQTTKGPITVGELIDLINNYDAGAITAGAISVTSIDLGGTTDTTITRSGAGAIQVEGVQVILSGAALGTPASGTLTNCTGLPAAGVSGTALTNGGALGTPSSGTLTNCTGLPAAGVSGTAVVQARSVSASGLASGGGDLSADRTITVTAATASDQETATSTTAAVVPNVQQRHPSASKIWCASDSAGNILASYNVTSISDGGTGTVTVTIATDFSGSFTPVLGVQDSQGKFDVVTSASAGSVTSVCVNVSTDPSVVADCSGHFISAFGDQ